MLSVVQTHILSTSEQWKNAWRNNWSNPQLQRVRVAVAYCSRSGATEIIQAQKAYRTPTQLLVGLNDGVTDICAIQTLLLWEKEGAEVTVRSTLQKNGRFHPKIYIFETATQWRVLIGSVNLTRSAFDRNTEAAVEWIFARSTEAEVELLHIFDNWWNNAETLNWPDEPSKLSLEERLIQKMSEGILVEIEAELFPARAHFEEDIFDLGHDVNVQEGLISVERQRRAEIFLIGSEAYRNLEKWRDKAHINLRSLSFDCTNGHFVPMSALDAWKRQHQECAREFTNSLENFTTTEGRAAMRAQLEQELPVVIATVWKKIHRSKEITSEQQQKIIEASLAQFDARAADFARLVQLKILQSPHPFPLMATSSPEVFGARLSLPVQRELSLFAHENRESILRNWMTTLLCTTRKLIWRELNQLKSKKLKAATRTSLRISLCQKLTLLNFYHDAFCLECVEILSSTSRDEHQIEALRQRAKQDYDAIEEWPQKSFDAVKSDFAIRAGWRNPK